MRSDTGSDEPMAEAKEEGTAAGYDCWAASYDDTDPTASLDEPFLIRHLGLYPGCRILDLGSGTGRYLRRLPPGPYRITAMDLSGAMLARARRQCAAREGLTWVQGSVTSLPFAADSFDRVMSGLVIDHVAAPQRYFQELARVLAPGGRAVVAGVHPDMQRLTGPHIDVGAGDGRSARIEGHIHEVTDLAAAATMAGFALDALEEPSVTEPMVAERPAWRRKLGCRALVLMALSLPGGNH